MSDRWASAAELLRLTQRDKGFEKFILKHVDELMSPEQAERIQRNAEQNCPKGGFRLCKMIAKRVGSS
jgi:hypothetical protein